MNLFLEAFLNLFFRFILGLLVVFFAAPAFAINLMAVYTSACKRELGAIIDIKNFQVSFLTTKGKVISLRPHQIIYLAYYPIDQFPVSGEVNVDKVQAFEVQTIVHDQKVPLLEGWPIGFTKDKVSFLTIEGRENIIDKRNIYELNEHLHKSALRFKKSNSTQGLVFHHPYAFKDCDLPKQAKHRDVYPQQVLSNPIMIKRELDALQQGYERMRDYNHEQQFYAVPEVYKNLTTLGLWQNFGSRYGSSSGRFNNVAPVLMDSYSSDIFNYQHTFVTGSYPLFYSAHGEAQTQAYYAFKASYFHMQMMFDPSIFLVGKKYEWSPRDFEASDDKLMDRTTIEMGFDFGNWSVNLFVTDLYGLGVSVGDEFQTVDLNVPRLGLTYRNNWVTIDGSTGSSATEPVFENSRDNFSSLSFSRVNLRQDFDRWGYILSFIHKEVNFDYYNLQYNSTSNSAIGYGIYKLTNRYRLGTYLGVEFQSNQFGLTSLIDSAEKTYFKGGVYGSISF